ncbi:MAG: hypothetical protein ACR2M1_05250 [Gemmatimonadaceae bacterium]
MLIHIVSTWHTTMKYKHIREQGRTVPREGAGIMTGSDVAALRAAGVRIHSTEPHFGPDIGIWITGLLVTLDTAPPRPVVQCVRAGSATDPDAQVRGRYVATDDADAAAMFNRCLSLWTRALPLECTLRGQQTGMHGRATTETRRPERQAQVTRRSERHAA